MRKHYKPEAKTWKGRSYSKVAERIDVLKQKAKDKAEKKEPKSC